MDKKPTQLTTEDWIQVPDWNQHGISKAYAVVTDYEKASEYIDPTLLELQQLGYGRLAMSNIVPGGTYEFGSGTATAPGIRWASDPNTGFYWDADGTFHVSINGVKEVTFNSSGILVTDLTVNRLVIAGTGGQLRDDADLTYSTGSNLLTANSMVVIGVHLEIGTATDASTIGDFVSGLTGASRVFFDQSLQTLSVYDSAGNEDLSLDVAANAWYNGAGNFGFGTVSPEQKVEITSSTGTQLRLSHTDSNNSYCTFGVDSSGNLYITPWTGGLIMNTAADVSAGPVFIEVTNADSPGGDARLELAVLDTAGDAVIRFEVASVATVWNLGVDNSVAGDPFKLCSSSAGLGTNDRLTITTSGYTTITPGVLATGTAHMLQVTGPINTGGTNGLFRVLAAASTGQTASTEIKFLDLDLGATTTWATGAIANQRCVFIEAPTLAFAGPSTVTNAATVYIDRAPQVGTNATITNAYALWVDDGAVRFDGGITFSSLTLGSVLFAGTGGVISQDNSNFFWDDTNNRLGIGTAGAPACTLHARATSVTVAAGTVYNFEFLVDDANVEGLHLKRSATGAPIGLSLWSGGTKYWGYAMDYTTTDLVLAFDVQAGKDIIRMSQATGACMWTYGATTPDADKRLQLLSTSSDAAAMRYLLDIDATSGSPVTVPLLVRSTDSATLVALRNNAGGEYYLGLASGATGHAWIGAADGTGLKIADAGTVTAHQTLLVGTTTTTSTAGDVAFGLTGAAEFFYDQSAAQVSMYSSAGTELVRLAALNTGEGLRLTKSGDAGRNFLRWNQSTRWWQSGFRASPYSWVLETISSSSPADDTGWTSVISATTGGAVAIGTSMTVGTAEAGSLSPILGVYASGVGAYIVSRETSNNVEAFMGADTTDTYVGNRSAHTFHLHVNSSNRLDIDSAGNLVFNESGNDSNLRAEGDSLAFMLYLNADATLENIALLTTAEPNWQTMDGGIFIGNASTVPTGNPTSGGYLYVEAGALKWRGPSGAITTAGAA